MQRRGVDHAVGEQCIQVDHAARQGQRLEHGELDASRHTEEEERFQHDRGGTVEAWQLDIVRVSCLLVWLATRINYQRNETHFVGIGMNV